MSQRGFGLANTLVVIAIVAILAFTVSAVSLSHLNFATRMANGRQAQNVAESTLAMAVKELLLDDSYGRARNRSLELTPYLGARGRVTFDPNQARAWNVGFSTNNLEGPNPVPGNDPDRPVPRNSAQLVVEGSYRGVTRRVEMVLYVPPFPYAIASAAPFHSSGGLEVGAVSDSGELSDLDPEALLAADLATNAAGGSALVLGPNTHIAGNVRSAGDVQLDPGAQVRGEIKSYSAPVTIPKEDVRSYDPEVLGKPNLQKLAPGTTDAPVYQGFVKVPGSLTVSNGLTLDNGVLFVDGNLTVTGGVQGSGALFVTGKTTLMGGSNLTTDNTVALMSTGDVTLVGEGKHSSAFQGLLYTEGSLRAEQMSLMGVFIQNNPSAVVELSDASLIYVPDHATVELTVAPRGQSNLTSANIFLDRDGRTFTGQYGDNGPVVFEAYPVTTGGWDLVNPTTGQITHHNNVTDLAEKIHQAYHKAEKGGHLVGIKDSSGESTEYSISLDYHSQIKNNVIAQLAGVAPRPPNSSNVLAPPKGERLTIDPSRFLSLKDRARVLYWRAR